MGNKKIYPRMHVSLHVNNIVGTVNFYDRFFGVPADKVKDDYAKYELNEPALTISFIENKGGVKPGFGHLGIQVATKEELNDKLNLAREYKLVKVEETGTSCCYALQDKFWVNDPDGYEWEVYHFIDDTEEMRGVRKEGKGCCTN